MVLIVPGGGKAEPGFLSYGMVAPDAMDSMVKVLIRVIFTALALFVATVQAVSAARVEGLFQAEVDVAGRDTVSRNKAIQLAMEEVLLRVTGSSAYLRDEEAKSLLSKPGRFVEQFRFQQLPAEQDGEAPRLQMKVQFDGIALARAVRSAGLPFWGGERPDVLMWLAIDDQGRRFLVSEVSGDEVVEPIRQAAGRRGLPLTLPLMDLEDQSAVRFTDVWGNFATTLEAGSERYRTQVILVGRLGRSRPDDGWQGEWSLLAPGQGQNWRTHEQELEGAVNQGVAGATERLAMQYAMVVSDESLRPMVVEGIHGLQDYARVYAYLESLSPVDRVQVARVTGDEIEFTLELSAEERNLLQVITLGKRLEPVDDPSFWRFRYRP